MLNAARNNILPFGRVDVPIQYELSARERFAAFTLPSPGPLFVAQGPTLPRESIVKVVKATWRSQR